MFSVSEITLSILKMLDQSDKDLYAIVPYAYEYVRLATRTGGLPSLAKRVVCQIAFSTNLLTVATSMIGLVKVDPVAFLKTYLIYDISRIRSASRKNARLKSVLLHEIVTEMGLAFNLDWLFKSYVDFLLKLKIRPGFETRNFAYLVNKFREWNIDFSQITIAAPFNKIGFQMNPSRIECEKALDNVSGSEIVAMSILAAGYLRPSEAIEYIANLPNITHVVVGVSRERHASETFRLLKQGLEPCSSMFNSDIVLDPK